MKITQRQLRQVIRSVLNEQYALEEAPSMKAAKVEGPLKDFVTHLNLAKKDLGNVYQQVSDPTATKQAEALLSYIDRIMAALDKMPELTQDPWSDPGHRRNLTCLG